MSSLALENSPGGFLDPRRPNWLRSMLLLCAGAAAGLGMAGAGLVRTHAGVPRGPPVEDVALVNGRPILRSDFRAQLEAKYATPLERSTAAQRKAVLDEMIREELLVQKGLRLDEPWTSPEVRGALLTTLQQKVIADVVTTPAKEAELVKYYQDHRSSYFSYGRMTLHHLFEPASMGDAAGRARAAEAAARELHSGEAVDAVAARHHLVKDAAAEGELFALTAKLRLGDRLFATADALGDGQARAVVAADGVHVLAMVRNRHPAPRSYAEVRETVLGDYQRERQQRVEAAEVGYLKRKAAIFYAPGYAP